MDSFGERLSAVIKSLGINQAKMADQLNVSQAFVSQLCSGAKKPSERTIRDICEKFHVNEAWLRDGIGDDMFRSRTKEEEIAAFMGDLLSGEPDFKRHLIAALAKLDESQWAALESIAQKLLEAMKEKGPGH